MAAAQKTGIGSVSAPRAGRGRQRDAANQAKQRSESKPRPPSQRYVGAQAQPYRSHGGNSATSTVRGQGCRHHRRRVVLPAHRLAAPVRHVPTSGSCRGGGRPRTSVISGPLAWLTDNWLTILEWRRRLPGGGGARRTGTGQVAPLLTRKSWRRLAVPGWKRKAAAMTALVAQGIRKSFGRREVLAGLDLEIKAGEMVAIVGENGSGKTTLLRILASDLRPDEGSVVIQGRPGYCPQAVVLDDALTVDQHVRYFQAAYGIGSPRRARELIERLGYSACRGELTGNLSGGTRQKPA